MSAIVISMCLIFALLVITEFAWRKKSLRPEVARKIIHVIAGSIVAAWPFFMSWRTIQLLSLALLIVVVVSQRFRIFGSIHSVKRSTRGEILYPIGIGLCALFEPAPWIFTAAILHLAIADGLAAILGTTKWGKRTRYSLGLQTKSLVGTGAFFLASLMIISTSYILLDSPELGGVSAADLLLIAGLATFVENISWYGMDNVSVPLVVLFMLSSI